MRVTRSHLSRPIYDVILVQWIHIWTTAEKLASYSDNGTH